MSLPRRFSPDYKDNISGESIPAMALATDQDNDFYQVAQQELDSVLPVASNMDNFQIDPYLLEDRGAGPYYAIPAANPNNEINSIFNSIPQPAQVPASITHMVPLTSAVNCAGGPSWHPAVGWHYPVIVSSDGKQATPPQQPSIISAINAFLTPPDSFTPARSNSAVPSKAPTRAPTPAPSSKNDTSALVEMQSKKRKNSDSDAGPRKKKRTPSIVQGCICYDTTHQKIKRPKNAFILFRSSHAKELMGRTSVTSNQEVSKKAAKMWKDASKEVKDHFYALAREETRKHKLKYPGYKYTPGETARSRFGYEDCTCGAYAANMAALKAKEGSPAASEQRLVAVTDADVLGIPQEEISGSQWFNIPMAPMLPQETINVSPKSNTRALPGNEEIVTVRRSTRTLAKKDISYAEDEGGDAFDWDSFAAPMIAAQDKRRPSPILTAQPAAETGTINPQALTKFVASPTALGTPSQNTRSKQTPSFSTMDFGFDDVIDWNGLFPGGPLSAAGLDGDNIFVATRPSSVARGSNRPRSSHTLRSVELRTTSAKSAGGR